MHGKWIAVSLALACSLGATSSAFAKHEKKEKFWDGDCKVERKWKKDGRYEEKRKCASGPYAEPEPLPPVVIALPPVVVMPGRY